MLGQRWGGGARPRAARAARHPAPGDQAHREAHACSRRSSCSAASTAAGPSPTRCIRARGARGEAQRLGGQALGRPEAAAVAGVRAGQRSRAAVPRRAHHRPRSAVAPPAVGPDRGVPRAAAAPCCSPPTTWTRPSGCATGSRSSTTASVIALGTPRRADRRARRRARGRVRGRRRSSTSAPVERLPGVRQGAARGRRASR